MKARDAGGFEYIDATADDHATIVSPRQAIYAGADFIVVGRPIVLAEDPVEAALAVIAEIERLRAVAPELLTTAQEQT